MKRQPVFYSDFESENHLGSAVDGQADFSIEIYDPAWRIFGTTSQISEPSAGLICDHEAVEKSIRARAAVGNRTREPPVRSATNCDDIG